MKEGVHMKKKTLGFVALAMTFLANTAALAAVPPKDMVGAIRAIDPWDPDTEQVIPDDSPLRTIESSRKVGDKAWFRIRLENKNSSAIKNTYGTDSGKLNLRNPWRFEFDFDNTAIQSLDDATIYERFRWEASAPTIGVWVSGRFCEAKIENFGEAKDKPWFFDLYCSYFAQ